MIQHHRNDFYRRQQAYEEEDYEDYEEEASEPDEEEQEAPRSTKEEQDFLKLREQLKDKIRQKLKKQSSSRGRVPQTQKGQMVANGTFGSFFGPSQPSIAPRVIEESRSIRETKHIMTNFSSPSIDKKKDPGSSGSKSVANHHNHQQPRIVNQVKNKAQALKDMRDYSFLLSDDADFPSPVKEQPKPRNVSSSSFDGRVAQPSLKSKMPSDRPARPTSTGHQLKKPPSSNQHLQNKVRQGKESMTPRPRPSSDGFRKVSGDVRNAPGRTTSNAALKNKVPNQTSVVNKPPRNMTNESSMKKNILSSKSHSSAKNHYPEQKRFPPAMDRAKTTMKQPMSSSKSEPSKQISSRGIYMDRPNKKPVKRKVSDDDDADDYRKAIREMFGYNPNKYAEMDDDDSDMEVGFDVIQKEERMSSKIAKKEDEEQLRLIEEEEERERRMRMKKKQKQR
ncbi:hypothetical protein Cni_G24159 [Canna indica]|uniref:SPT2 chromatin protein n=1 Tax=Canna indica TaxID=4628 RepID=A0AAQ3KUS0_9LILI|nr:hypothetical protein Cni_G24159 [Canna indica]